MHELKSKFKITMEARDGTQSGESQYVLSKVVPPGNDQKC